jgi:hypothetical protein
MNRAGGAKFFMLETHYDNPNLQSGIVDHSGLRLFYTSQLRYRYIYTIYNTHTHILVCDWHSSCTLWQTKKKERKKKSEFIPPPSLK